MPDRKSFEDAVIDRIMSQMDDMVDGVAARLGLPPGAKRYTPDEQLKMATFSPITDPNERMMKAAEMLGQGATVEDVTDALYPDIRKLIETTRRLPEERIAFARTLRGQIDQKMSTAPQTLPESPAPAWSAPAPMTPEQPLTPAAPMMQAPSTPQMPQPVMAAPWEIGG